MYPDPRRRRPRFELPGSAGAGPRHFLPIQETLVRSLGREDILEKEMTTHSSILAWEIPWTEKPGGLQSMGSQKVGHNLATKQHQQHSNKSMQYLSIMNESSQEFQGLESY